MAGCVGVSFPLRLEPAELVFVEVKTRSSEQWGYPEEAVTPAKQKIIFKTVKDMTA